MTYPTEAAMVEAFVAEVKRKGGCVSWRGQTWVPYAETGGFDLLLVEEKTGLQIGIEAKLSLNAKVLAQAIPRQYYFSDTGPDYRAVLVPQNKCQLHMKEIAAALGITVITIWPSEMRRGNAGADIRPYHLPSQETYGTYEWFPFIPAQRVKLPEYVPDVCGGHSAPVALTHWKIKAIKLMILLERRGYVTRHDMKLLQISPSRWTERHAGYLSPDTIKGGYVWNERTPDLKAQHPVNYVQIEADFDKWAPKELKPTALFAANDDQFKESAA